MQHCAPIVTGEIGKEFIGECWTYSISVLIKLQLKIVQVFYPNFSFCVQVERNITSLLLNFPLSLKTRIQEKLA